MCAGRSRILMVYDDKNTTVSARVSSDYVKRAKKHLSKSGLSLSELIRMVIYNAANDKLSFVNFRYADSEEQSQVENEKAKIKRIYQFVDDSLHFQYWRDNVSDPMEINLLRDLFAMLMFYEASSLNSSVDSIAEIAFDNLLTENSTQENFVNYGMSLLEQSDKQKVSDNLLFKEFIANDNSVEAMLPYKDHAIIFLKQLYGLLTLNPIKGGN